ncbi:MAG: DNA replication and repair protein RecF [Ferruginibacter sp.]
MLSLSRIILTQFKNYEHASFDFGERVTGICGLNGRGKTNLLDAIYYCCFTRSYFAKNDGLNVLFGHDGFRLETFFRKNTDVMKLVCINRVGGKKELSLNDVAYEKFSAHIGQFPAVMVAPDDIELIAGGSEERRRFMDTVLSQMDAEYLQKLIEYNKVLLQRNSLLKRFAEQGTTDWALLEVLDEQLVQPGTFIHQRRRTFADSLIPRVRQFYRQIAGNQEEVRLQYSSQLNDTDFFDLLNHVRQKDFILQRSNAGIHKDDLLVQLGDQVFKAIASQGQRKSLLFALKLAEFEMLKENKGYPPLLLLDDVFEKLDDNRMRHLLHWVCRENSGQVFITDTHRDRLEEAFEKLGTAYQVIEL